jgi:hypothetical protein
MFTYALQPLRADYLLKRHTASTARNAAGISAAETQQAPTLVWRLNCPVHQKCFTVASACHPLPHRTSGF